MKPVSFPEQNIVFAKNQPPYRQLPAHSTEDGLVLSCWKMNVKERLYALFTGKVWLSLMTFNQPPQPQFLQVDSPFERIHRKNKNE